MTFGEKLVYYRTKKNLSQKSLAEVLDITPTRLNYWEKDKREPDIAMIGKLAKILDVSANVLIGLKEDEETKKSPAPEGTEEKLSEEDMKFVADLRAVLAKHGLLGADGDITAEQGEILYHTVCLLRAAIKESVQQ